MPSAYPRKFVIKNDPEVYWLCEAGSPWAVIYNANGKTIARNSLETLVALCQCHSTLYQEVLCDPDLWMDEGL
jgi:hypothetical protein